MYDLISHLERLQPGVSRRVSSWDQTGRNRDCIAVGPGETAVLADIEGPGRITHLYFTMIQPSPLDYRDSVLRMFWDDESTPSVEVPFGDFFCIGNTQVRRFASLLVCVNPGHGDPGANNGLNAYFPMPFATRARIEMANESDRYLGGLFGGLWYHIDYEAYQSPEAVGQARFHAQWRRENLTVPASPPKPPHENRGPFESNLDGRENYVLLEAAGKGHVAGMFLEVDNLQGGWYGEGDDMIFIDGDTWPPSIHGTGTEEIFGGGAGPDREYAGPFSGFLQVENAEEKPFQGKNAMYRWYLHDPIRFQRSIRMTIEHGHANNCANDYSSVVYWYQTEPHAPFPTLLPRDARRPHLPPPYYAAHAQWDPLLAAVVPYYRDYVFDGADMPPWAAAVRPAIEKGMKLMEERKWHEVAELLAQAQADFQV